MQFTQHGILGKRTGPNYYIVGLIGDSNVVGFGATVGPTTAAGTCYYYNSGTNALVELTTADLPGATSGSAWKQFALTLYGGLKRPVVFVQGGVSGSSFWPNVTSGTTNNWQVGPTGVCYDNWKTNMTACLALLGRIKPDLIAGNLGINDEQGAVSTADFITGVDNVMDQLDVDYPGVQKLWTQIGRSSASVNDASIYLKRFNLRAQVEAHPTHAMAWSGIPPIYTTGYVAGNVHYTTATLNWWGNSFAKFVIYNGGYNGYSPITNKWANGVVSSLFTAPAAGGALQTAWDDLITTLYNGGVYMTTESAGFLRAATSTDLAIDYSFITALSVTGATQTANQYLRFDGVNDFAANGLTPSFYIGSMSQDDCYGLVKVLTNRDIASVNAALFGSANTSAPVIGITQNGSSQLTVRVNDVTVSTMGTTKFANNTFYGCRRLSGEKAIIADAAQTTFSVASTGLDARDMVLGAINSNGTLALFLDCDLTHYSFGQWSPLSSLTLSTFETKVQAVLDAF